MQTILLLPLMVAPVVAAIMIRWMFNDQFGIVNVVLDAIGTRRPALADAALDARSGVILLTDVWLWTPWFTLLLLAGLQSLPKEPFEAAAIDGTSAWRVFRYLTVPMLRPVIVVCVVIRAIDAFRTFDIVWTITGGGPARSTELFSHLRLRRARSQSLNFGRGSAAAIIGALIILVFGMVLYRSSTAGWRCPSDRDRSHAVEPLAGFFRAGAGRRRALFALGADRGSACCSPSRCCG